MADTYTKGDSPSTNDKQIKITRTWKEDREESFTVTDLERQIDNCDNEIKNATDRKVKLQAMITEAEKVIAE
jgi:hypothetical protein